MNAKGTVYISGPITNDLDNYHDHFRLAKRLIQEAGYTAISPDVLPLGLQEKDYMRISLSMLEAADMVVLLRGWTSSVGAQIEAAYAKRTGKRVQNLLEFCEENHVLAQPEEGSGRHGQKE